MYISDIYLYTHETGLTACLTDALNSAPAADTKNGTGSSSNGSTGTAGTGTGTTAGKTHVKSASISSASGAPPLGAEAQPHNASARDLAQPRPRYHTRNNNVPLLVPLASQ